MRRPTERRAETSTVTLGHDALPACAAPLLRSAGSTGAGRQALTGHAATRCSWRAWDGGTAGGARAHLVHAAALRSASASRVSTIWEHGLFVRHSWKAHCKLSFPFESHETANRGSGSVRGNKTRTKRPHRFDLFCLVVGHGDPPDHLRANSSFSVRSSNFENPLVEVGRRPIFICCAKLRGCGGVCAKC